MQANPTTPLYAIARAGVFLLALSGAAFAQNASRIPVKTSKGDTWQMTCNEARSKIGEPGGTL